MVEAGCANESHEKAANAADAVLSYVYDDTIEEGAKPMNSRILIVGLCGLLAGCADLSITRSWEGRPMRDLVAQWGPPTEIHEVAQGGKHLIYRVSEDSYPVTAGDVRKHLVVRRCFATFTADARGRIVTSGQEGTPGACGKLLAGRERGRPAP